MPPLQIVMFPDPVAKAWGWERLLPICPGIECTLDAVAKRCIEKENQLACEWKILLESCKDVISVRKNIILSSLVKECAHSVIHKEGEKSSGALAGAAFMCIEKETDLILELLRLRARPNDYLIEESSKIRMCALCLMGHSDIAAGAMLGIAKETKGEKIRHRTLEYMTSVLIMPYNPAAAVLKPSMEATNTRGDDASDTLNCQDQEKIIDADNIKKSKGIEETKREIIEDAGFTG
ncbi:hypothetical protein QOZ80_3AG0244550 [Eleusine coracana subsp. coracana]|nr:hypothetical protein QOZ80_3AG0244550 [Eleusine coracana subsp. coracana]